jgi:hypothetical protein
MTRLKNEVEIVLLSLMTFFTGVFRAAEANETLPVATVQVFEDLKSESSAVHPDDFEQWVTLNPQQAALFAEKHYEKSEFRELLPQDINESLELFLKRREGDGSSAAAGQIDEKQAS